MTTTQAVVQGSTPANPSGEPLPSPRAEFVRDPNWLAAALKEILRDAAYAAQRSPEDADLTKVVWLESGLERLIESISIAADEATELLCELEARNLPGIQWWRGCSALYGSADSADAQLAAARDLRLKPRGSGSHAWQGRIDGCQVIVTAPR